MMNFIRESVQALSINVFTNVYESYEADEDSVPMCQDTGGFATLRPSCTQANE